MEEKQREQKRARTVRSDYLTDLDEVQSWIRQAELKVQDRSIEPIVLKEHLKEVQDQLGSISDKLERLTRNGGTIVENTRDDAEKQLIESTVHNVTEQLNQVKSWLDERKQLVADTLDAWQRFLTLYEAVKAWTGEKKQFLIEPLQLTTLVQARQRLHEYSTAVKSCKQINKNLSDMGKELENIGQVCSVGDLPEKLVEAEEEKVQVEGQLLERNALLQETSEEWEQCERKMKEVKSWIEKARQSLESLQNKKKPLRDQHSIREKMLSDIGIQKTKISISMEKLQVHFRSGIGGDSRISETVVEMLAELDGLHSNVKEQTTSLESCLAQIDQYQQEIQQLRQQIMQVEQQLRTVLSPTYLSSDKEKALQEQQSLQQRMDDWRQRVRSLVDQIYAVDPYYVHTNEYKFVNQASYADIAAGRTSPSSRGSSPYRNPRDDTPPTLEPLAVQILRPAAQKPILEAGKDTPSTRIQRRETTSKRHEDGKAESSIEAEGSRVRNREFHRGPKLENVEAAPRQRAQTRKHTSGRKDTRESSKESVDRSKTGSHRSLLEQKKNKDAMVTLKNTLVPREDNRGRSVSPIWGPGSASYADILRGNAQQASQATFEASKETFPVVQKENIEFKATSLEKNVQNIQVIPVEQSSQAHVGNYQENPEISNIKIEEHSPAARTSWPEESLENYDLKHYENVTRQQVTEVYNYIHPPMPELVGFIGTQIAYPVSPYVYMPSAPQRQMPQIETLSRYNETQMPFPADQYAARANYLPETDIYQQNQKQQSQQARIKSNTKKAPMLTQNLEEKKVSEKSSLPVALLDVTTVPTKSVEVVGADQEIEELISVAEPSSDTAVTKQKSPPSESKAFSYAQILSQGLSTRPVQISGSPTSNSVRHRMKERSDSPVNSPSSSSLHENTPPRGEKESREKKPASIVVNAPKPEEPKWDTTKKRETKRIQHETPKLGEKKSRKVDQSKANKPPKEKISLPEEIVEIKSQVSVETSTKNIEVEVQPDDIVKNITQEKKRKPKKKKTEKSTDDEIDKALKEIGDMEKQKMKNQKEKTVEQPKGKPSGATEKSNKDEIEKKHLKAREKPKKQNKLKTETRSKEGTPSDEINANQTAAKEQLKSKTDTTDIGVTEDSNKVECVKKDGVEESRMKHQEKQAVVVESKEAEAKTQPKPKLEAETPSTKQMSKGKKPEEESTSKNKNKAKEQNVGPQKKADKGATVRVDEDSEQRKKSNVETVPVQTTNEQVAGATKIVDNLNEESKIKEDLKILEISKDKKEGKATETKVEPEEKLQTERKEQMDTTMTRKDKITTSVDSKGIDEKKSKEQDKSKLSTAAGESKQNKSGRKKNKEATVKKSTESLVTEERKMQKDPNKEKLVQQKETEPMEILVKPEEKLEKETLVSCSKLKQHQDKDDTKEDKINKDIKIESKDVNIEKNVEDKKKEIELPVEQSTVEIDIENETKAAIVALEQAVESMVEKTAETQFKVTPETSKKDIPIEEKKQETRTKKVQENPAGKKSSEKKVKKSTPGKETKNVLSKEEGGEIAHPAKEVKMRYEKKSNVELADRPVSEKTSEPAVARILPSKEQSDDVEKIEGPSKIVPAVLDSQQIMKKEEEAREQNQTDNLKVDSPGICLSENIIVIESNESKDNRSLGKEEKINETQLKEPEIIPDDVSNKDVVGPPKDKPSSETVVPTLEKSKEEIITDKQAKTSQEIETKSTKDKVIVEPQGTTVDPKETVKMSDENNDKRESLVKEQDWMKRPGGTPSKIKKPSKSKEKVVTEKIEPTYVVESKEEPKTSQPGSPKVGKKSRKKQENKNKTAATQSSAIDEQSGPLGIFEEKTYAEKPVLDSPPTSTILETTAQPIIAKCTEEKPLEGPSPQKDQNLPTTELNVEETKKPDNSKQVATKPVPDLKKHSSSFYNKFEEEVIFEDKSRKDDKTTKLRGTQKEKSKIKPPLTKVESAEIKTQEPKDVAQTEISLKPDDKPNVATSIEESKIEKHSVTEETTPSAAQVSDSAQIEKPIETSVTSGKAMIIEKMVTTVTTTTSIPGSVQVKPPNVKSVKSVEIIENIPLPKIVGSKLTELITLRPETVEANLTTRYARVSDDSAAGLSLKTLDVLADSQDPNTTAVHIENLIDDDQIVLFGSIQERKRPGCETSLSSTSIEVSRTEDSSVIVQGKVNEMEKRSLSRNTSEVDEFRDSFEEKVSLIGDKEKDSNAQVTKKVDKEEIKEDDKISEKLNAPDKTVKFEVEERKLEESNEKEIFENVRDLPKIENDLIKPYWLNYHSYAEAENEFYRRFKIVQELQKSCPRAATPHRSSSIERIVKESVMRKPESESIEGAADPVAKLYQAETERIQPNGTKDRKPVSVLSEKMESANIEIAPDEKQKGLKETIEEIKLVQVVEENLDVPAVESSAIPPKIESTKTLKCETPKEAVKIPDAKLKNSKRAGKSKKESDVSTSTPVQSSNEQISKLLEINQETVETSSSPSERKMDSIEGDSQAVSSTKSWASIVSTEDTPETASIPAGISQPKKIPEATPKELKSKGEKSEQQMTEVEVKREHQGQTTQPKPSKEQKEKHNLSEPKAPHSSPYTIESEKPQAAQEEFDYSEFNKELNKSYAAVARSYRRSPTQADQEEISIIKPTALRSKQSTGKETGTKQFATDETLIAKPVVEGKIDNTLLPEEKEISESNKKSLSDPLPEKDRSKLKHESPLWIEEIENEASETDSKNSQNTVQIETQPKLKDSWASVVGKHSLESADTCVGPVIKQCIMTKEQTSEQRPISQVQILVEEAPDPIPIENVVRVDDQGFMEFVNRRELRSRRSRSRSRSRRRDDVPPPKETMKQIDNILDHSNKVEGSKKHDSEETTGISKDEDEKSKEMFQKGKGNDEGVAKTKQNKMEERASEKKVSKPSDKKDTVKSKSKKKDSDTSQESKQNILKPSMEKEQIPDKKSKSKSDEEKLKLVMIESTNIDKETETGKQDDGSKKTKKSKKVKSEKGQIKEQEGMVESLVKNVEVKESDIKLAGKVDPAPEPTTSQEEDFQSAKKLVQQQIVGPAAEKQIELKKPNVTDEHKRKSENIKRESVLEKPVQTSTEIEVVSAIAETLEKEHMTSEKLKVEDKTKEEELSQKEVPEAKINKTDDNQTLEIKEPKKKDLIEKKTVIQESSQMEEEIQTEGKLQPLKKKKLKKKEKLVPRKTDDETKILIPKEQFSADDVNIAESRGQEVKEPDSPPKVERVKSQKNKSLKKSSVKTEKKDETNKPKVDDKIEKDSELVKVVTPEKSPTTEVKTMIEFAIKKTEEEAKVTDVKGQEIPDKGVGTVKAEIEEQPRLEIKEIKPVKTDRSETCEISPAINIQKPVKQEIIATEPIKAATKTEEVESQNKKSSKPEDPKNLSSSSTTKQFDPTAKEYLGTLERSKPVKPFPEKIEEPSAIPEPNQLEQNEQEFEKCISTEPEIESADIVIETPEPQSKVQFYIADEILVLSPEKRKPAETPLILKTLSEVSRSKFLSLDSGFWPEKHPYHEAERYLFENLSTYAREKIPDDIPYGSNDPDDDGDRNDPESNDRDENGDSFGSYFLGAPQTERLVADLPGGIGSLSDYSTYLSSENETVENKIENADSGLPFASETINFSRNELNESPVETCKSLSIPPSLSPIASEMRPVELDFEKTSMELLLVSRDDPSSGSSCDQGQRFEKTSSNSLASSLTPNILHHTPVSKETLGRVKESMQHRTSNVGPGNQTLVAEDEALKRIRGIKDIIQERLTVLKLSLANLKGTYLPRESISSMLSAVTALSEELRSYEQETAHLQEELRKIPADVESQKLLSSVTEIETRISTLLSQAEQGRLTLEEARDHQEKRGHDIHTYKQFLHETDAWLRNIVESMKEQRSITSNKALQDELSSHAQRVSELESLPEISTLAKVLKNAFLEVMSRLHQRQQEMCEEEAQADETSDRNDATLDQASSIHSSLEGSSPSLADVSLQTGESLLANVVVDKPPRLTKQTSTNEMPGATTVRHSLTTQTMETNDNPQTQEAIKILKTTEGDHDVIEIATKNLATTSSQEIVDERRDSMPEDIVVDMRYQDPKNTESTTSELNIVHAAPQSFETVLFEPDDVTTEVVVDEDGTKRIIVRKLRRTFLTSRQATQHHLSSMSTAIGNAPSVMHAFSEATMRDQRMTVTTTKPNGTIETTTKQTYGGRVTSGTPYKDVDVEEYESPPQCSHMVSQGQIRDITPQPLEEEILMVGGEYQTKTSSVHAVVQQVTRRVVRKTRRIIRKITIIDGKETASEEIIEEPELVEIDEKNIPHISINVVKHQDRRQLAADGSTIDVAQPGLLVSDVTEEESGTKLSEDLRVVDIQEPRPGDSAKNVPDEEELSDIKNCQNLIEMESLKLKNPHLDLPVDVSPSTSTGIVSSMEQMVPDIQETICIETESKPDNKEDSVVQSNDARTLPVDSQTFVKADASSQCLLQEVRDEETQAEFVPLGPIVSEDATDTTQTACKSDDAPVKSETPGIEVESRTVDVEQHNDTSGTVDSDKHVAKFNVVVLEEEPPMIVEEPDDELPKNIYEENLVGPIIEEIDTEPDNTQEEGSLEINHIQQLVKDSLIPGQTFECDDEALKPEYKPIFHKVEMSLEIRKAGEDVEPTVSIKSQADAAPYIIVKEDVDISLPADKECKSVIHDKIVQTTPGITEKQVLPLDKSIVTSKEDQDIKPESPEESLIKAVETRSSSIISNIAHSVEINVPSSDSSRQITEAPQPDIVEMIKSAGLEFTPRDDTSEGENGYQLDETNAPADASTITPDGVNVTGKKKKKKKKQRLRYSKEEELSERSELPKTTTDEEDFSDSVGPIEINDTKTTRKKKKKKKKEDIDSSDKPLKAVASNEANTQTIPLESNVSAATSPKPEKISDVSVQTLPPEDSAETKVVAVEAVDVEVETQPLSVLDFSEQTVMAENLDETSSQTVIMNEENAVQTSPEIPTTIVPPEIHETQVQTVDTDVVSTEAQTVQIAPAIEVETQTPEKNCLAVEQQTSESRVQEKIAAETGVQTIPVTLKTIETQSQTSEPASPEKSTLDFNIQANLMQAAPVEVVETQTTPVESPREIETQETEAQTLPPEQTQETMMQTSPLIISPDPTEVRELSVQTSLEETKEAVEEESQTSSPEGKKTSESSVQSKKPKLILTVEESVQIIPETCEGSAQTLPIVDKEEPTPMMASQQNTELLKTANKAVQETMILTTDVVDTSMEKIMPVELVKIPVAPDVQVQEFKEDTKPREESVHQESVEEIIIKSKTVEPENIKADYETETGASDRMETSEAKSPSEKNSISDTSLEICVQATIEFGTNTTTDDAGNKLADTSTETTLTEDLHDVFKPDDSSLTKRQKRKRRHKTLDAVPRVEKVNLESAFGQPAESQDVCVELSYSDVTKKHINKEKSPGGQADVSFVSEMEQSKLVLPIGDDATFGDEMCSQSIVPSKDPKNIIETSPEPMDTTEEPLSPVESIPPLMEDKVRSKVKTYADITVESPDKLPTQSTKTISNRMQSLRNATEPSHLGNILHIAHLDKIATDQLAEERFADIRKELAQLKNAAQEKDMMTIEETIVVIVETISAWLESIEYRTFLSRDCPSGPAHGDKTFVELKDELENVEESIQDLTDIWKTVKTRYPEEERGNLQECLDALVHQVNMVESVTKDGEKCMGTELAKWDEFLNGVNNIFRLVEEQRMQLENIIEMDGSTEWKLQELEKLESTNRCHMWQTARLVSAAHDLLRDRPGQHIPEETYGAHEITKIIEHDISIERERLLQLLTLAKEYEETLSEFTQITEIAKKLLENPVWVTNLEDLQEEMQRHRKFFVNLNHCSAILESLEGNLDPETRTNYAELHEELHGKAMELLDKAASRAQQMSLAASRWILFEQGLKEERGWLQVALQRVPDLQTVTSSDYNQYISLYQSLAVDIKMHYTRLTRLLSLAGSIQELVNIEYPDHRYSEDLKVIEKLYFDVESPLRKLEGFGKRCNHQEFLSNRLENWMTMVEKELEALRDPSTGHIRQFWELKAQYEVHKRMREEASNSFEQALRLVPLSDEMLQRQFHRSLQDRWNNVTEKMTEIQERVTDNLSSDEITPNEKLKLLERELNELRMTVDSFHGVLKTEEELDLYIERLTVLFDKILFIQDELSRLGLLPAAENEKVGVLLSSAGRIENQISTELDTAQLLRERIQALQRGFSQVRENHQRFSSTLDQCEDCEGQGSHAVGAAVQDCLTVANQLSETWNIIMGLRQLLHTLPTTMRISMSPVSLERDMSNLQDAHTNLEARCSRLLASLNNKLDLWTRFEKQLKVVQQSVQEADYMMELLTIQGSVDYSRLLKATERLEGLSGDLGAREAVIGELRVAAEPLREGCTAEVREKVDAAVNEAVQAWEDTRAELDALCTKYQHACRVWEQYKNSSAAVKAWLDTQMDSVVNLPPEEALKQVKVCEETMAEHKERLAELRGLVAQIASDVGLDASGPLHCEVEALGQRLEDVRETLSSLADTVDANALNQQLTRGDLCQSKNYLDSVQQSLTTVSQGESKEQLRFLRNHLLALTCTEPQLQSLKERSLEVPAQEPSVVEVLQLWQMVFRDTFQQYHRLSARLVKTQDGATALKLWQEYLSHVQEFLSNGVPGDYSGLSEHRNLCEIHQNLLTNQQNLMLTARSEEGGNLSTTEQFSVLTNLHNEILARIMERHTAVRDRLAAWDTYRRDQSKLLAWLKEIERERGKLQLRFIHLRRIEKILERIVALLEKIPSGEAQLKSLHEQQESLLVNCGEALAVSIRMEHAASAQRIANLSACLETWRDFVQRVRKLNDKYVEQTKGISTVFEEIGQTLGTALQEIEPPSLRVSRASCQDRLQDLEQLKTRLAATKTDLESLGVITEQLRECLSPSDMKTLNQQSSILHQQHGDLEYQVALLACRLEERCGSYDSWENRVRLTLEWIEETETQLDRYDTMTPSEPEEALKSLEFDLNMEIMLRIGREHTWINSTVNDLLAPAQDEEKEQLETSLKKVNEAWKRLRAKAHTRGMKGVNIVRTMITLEKRITELRNWLATVESQLSEAFVIDSPSQHCVDKKLEDQDHLQKAIEAKSDEMSEVLNLCELLLNDCSAWKPLFNTDTIKIGMEGLERRWNATCVKSTERKAKIFMAWKLLQQLEKVKAEHEDWLNQADEALTKMENNLDDLSKEELSRALEQAKILADDVDAREAIIKSIEQDFGRLARTGLEPDNLKSLTGETRGMIMKWETLKPRISAILVGLERGQKTYRDFISAHGEAVLGLTQVDVRLTQIQHLATPEQKVSVRRRLQQLDQIEEELRTRNLTLQRADELALKLMQESHPDDVQPIQELVDEYQLLWGDIKTRVSSLKAEIENQGKIEIDEAVQVETLKFEQDSAVQVDTLPKLLTSNDAYLMELHAAMGECENALNTLEAIVTPDPVSGPRLNVTAKNISKLLGSCQSSIELVRHLHGLLVEHGKLSLEAARGNEVVEMITRYDNLLTLARTREQQIRELSDSGRLTCPLCSRRNWAQLDNDLWRLEKWLEFAEGTQSEQQSPPSKIEQLEDVIQDHREFLLDLDSHKSIVVSLNIVGVHLADHTEETSRASHLRERLAIANIRWDKVCNFAVHWQEELQAALMSNHQFHRIIEELLAWLEKTEISIRASEPVDLTESIEVMTGKYNKFRELRSDLERCEPRVLSLQESANQLLDEKGETRACLQELRLRLQSLRRLTGIYALKLGAALGMDTRDVGLTVTSSSLASLSHDLLDEAASGTVPPNVTPGTDGDEGDLTVLSRGYRFLGRVLRVSLPIQALMLLLLGVASLVPSAEEDYSCMLSNNLARSFTPMVVYPNGPPPI